MKDHRIIFIHIWLCHCGSATLETMPLFRIRFHSNFKFNLKSVWRKKSDKPNLTASFFIVFSFDVHPRRTFSQYISQKKNYQIATLQILAHRIGYVV